MTGPRLTKVELQGFRSFGIARQVFDLPDSIAVFWGGNSQGKTSLTEALEFLFSGQIARRDLMASTKDEFAEALRNVHMEPGARVVVEAELACADGAVHRLTRTLLDDYRRGNATGCTSQVELDGKRCDEVDIGTRLGFRLSHPPLRVPILAQHTLGYILSASPTERAAYFRAVLDVQDLEDFRSAVAQLQGSLSAPHATESRDLDEVEGALTFESARAIRKASTEDALSSQIAEAAVDLLQQVDVLPASSLESRADQIQIEMDRRRAQKFPTELLRRTQFSAWDGEPRNLVELARDFIAECRKVDAETHRLLALFRAALAMAPHPDPEGADACPLCGTEGTYTERRLDYVRGKVREAESYVAAVDRLSAAARMTATRLQALQESIRGATPCFMREGGRARRAALFTVARLRELIPEPHLTEPWLKSMRKLARSSSVLRRRTAAALHEVNAISNDRDRWQDVSKLEIAGVRLTDAQQLFTQAISEYEGPARELGVAITAVLATSTNTTGWEALIRLARNPSALWNARLNEVRYRAQVKALEACLRELDAGNGRVQDEKFSELSDGVKFWWEKLRPDEVTYFSAVQRRGDKTRRTIDLKAGLCAKEDRSDPKFRDAVAVFSQSQMHCLGLAIFLARATQEDVGFIVLDDPILSSDDDYRPNFTSSVLEALTEKHIQVIICTQDHKSWKEIGDRWGHRGALQFHMIRHDPVTGTEIRSEKDDLETMIAKARPLVKSQDPMVRKDGASRVREAIERLAKKILVRDRIAKGDGRASVTDYDGEIFGAYSGQVYALLIKDRSHPGKLRTAYANATPGPHDDKPPSSGELVHALGDVQSLKRQYLD